MIDDFEFFDTEGLFRTLVEISKNHKIVFVLTTQDPIGKDIYLLSLSFFTKKDVKIIIGKAEAIQFSGLSIEYLYRVTGGYPDLIQLICFHIVNERNGSNSKWVDLPYMVGVVQSSFQDWGNWGNLKGLDDYLSKEREGLKQLIVRSKSLRIKSDNDENGDLADMLKTLVKKEILVTEESLHIHKIRIGFIFLLEDLIVDTEEENLHLA